MFSEVHIERTFQIHEEINYAIYYYHNNKGGKTERHMMNQLHFKMMLQKKKKSLPLAVLLCSCVVVLAEYPTVVDVPELLYHEMCDSRVWEEMLLRFSEDAGRGTVLSGCGSHAEEMLETKENMTCTESWETPVSQSSVMFKCLVEVFKWLFAL